MSDELESSLEELKRNVAEPGFKERARAFESLLKRARLPNLAYRDFWDQYQRVWKERKRFVEERQRASEMSAAEYRRRLYSLDFNHDGGPILQDFADWRSVGDKTRSAREELNGIVEELKRDGSLFREHRDALFGIVREVRSAINSAADTARSVHDREAKTILSEVSRAIHGVPSRDARALLKEAQSSAFSLYISHETRDVLRGAFDDLWAQVKARAEEERAEWRARQEDGLARLGAARDRVAERLERVRSNVEANRERLSNARSAEYEARVQEWIEEGEEQARALEESLEELEAKIRNAEERLQD